MLHDKYSVLWVDDDAHTDKYSSTLQLFKPAFRLTILESPEQMEATLRTESFDVVLLDIVFGNQRTAGIDALKRIRSEYPGQRVLVLTGSSYGPDLDSIEEIRQASPGHVKFLEKPRRAVQIIEDIKSWMRDPPAAGTER
jgi:DNA-binding NtrC family response regulator